MQEASFRPAAVSSCCWPSRLRPRNAVARMPVGFFDDPSFRWSRGRRREPPRRRSARTARSSTCSPTGRRSRQSKPANPLNGNDPAYDLSDLDRSCTRPEQYGMRGAADDRGHARVGERRQDAELPADEHERPDAVRADAGDAVQRHERRLRRRCTRFSVWNEPNLGSSWRRSSTRTGRSSARRSTRSSTWPPTRASRPATRRRSSRRARPRTAAATARPRRTATTPSRRRRSRTCSRRRTRSCRSTRGRRIRTRPSTRSGPSQRVAYPNVAFSTMSALRRRPREVVPPAACRSGSPSTASRRRRSTTSGGVSYAQQAAGRRRRRCSSRSENPYVEMFIWFIFRDSDRATWFSGVVAQERHEEAGVRRVRERREEHRRLHSQTIAGREDVLGRRCPVPVMAYYNRPGTKVGLTYGLFDGKKKLAVAQPLLTLQSGGYVTIPVNYKAGQGQDLHAGGDRQRPARAHRQDDDLLIAGELRSPLVPVAAEALPRLLVRRDRVVERGRSAPGSGGPRRRTPSRRAPRATSPAQRSSSASRAARGDRRRRSRRRSG